MGLCTRHTASLWAIILPVFGTHSFLGAFTKLGKATIKHHVCPFVRLKKFGSHRTDFYEISYLSIVSKSVEKVQV